MSKGKHIKGIKPRYAKRTKDWYERRKCAAEAAFMRMSENEAAKCFRLTRNQIRYWKQKIIDPSYHPKIHGYRWSKLTNLDKTILYYLAKS